ncbi:SPOR domain-containing protein [Bradyrhizobium genosp. P]|uniref:SPOR domain-containing protein n=1 Tax=Bradyrhizobium genosp. P TaxID=83641 RepID=UPI003CE96FCB
MGPFIQIVCKNWMFSGRATASPIFAALLLLLINTAAAESPLLNVEVGRFVYLKGKVVQSLQSGADFWFRVDITPTDYGSWKDTIIVRYHAVSPLQLQYPIQESAVVEFQGWHRGKTSYQTALGATLELPLVDACLLWDSDDALRFAPPPGCPNPQQTAPAVPTVRPSTNKPSTQEAPAAGFFVQISSGFTERDAQAAFEFLQRRYSSVLGSGTPVIKRDDTAALYRAYIGPFQNSDEAAKYCERFKSVGGGICVQTRFDEEPAARSVPASNVRPTLRPQGGRGTLNLFGTKVRSDGAVVGAINNRRGTPVRRVRIACNFAKWEGGRPKEFIVDQVIPPEGFAQFVSGPLGIGPLEPEPISCGVAGYDN